MIRITQVILSFLLFALPIPPLPAAPDWPPLMEAAFHGDLRQVENLLNEGANVNQRDREGSTPLMVAASRGHSGIVRALLAKGALVNAQNTYGWTPLMMAAASGYPSIVKLLLAQGADPSMRNREGDTAVTIARSKGMSDLFATASAPEVTKPAPPPEREPVPPPEREPVPPPEREPERPAQKTDVERLLAQAEQQLRSLKLTLPAGNNAYETYQRVLKLEPGNSSARAGLQRIAEQYERLAQQREQAGALQESLSFVERGLQVAPQHPGLAALRRDVQARLAASERQPPAPEEVKAEEDRDTEQASRQRKVERLLAQARRQLKALKLTIPADDNAYDTYRQILELDPGNEEVREGLERIAAQYEKWAKRRQALGELQKSLVNVERGLGVLPDHPGLLALRDEIQARVAEQEQQRAAEEQRLAEQERQRAQEEEQRLAEQKRQRAEEERRRVEEEERLAEQERQRAEEERRRVEEEERLAEQERQRAEEERRRVEEEERRRQIERLLAEAKAQFERGKLTEPAGDNAYQTYQQVLVLDPGNQNAELGLKRLVGEAERVLREKMDILRRIEQELDAEELAMRLAIQRTLVQKWKQRAQPER